MTLIDHILQSDETPERKAAFLRRMASEACASGDLPLAVSASHHSSRLARIISDTVRAANKLFPAHIGFREACGD